MEKQSRKGIKRVGCEARIIGRNLLQLRQQHECSQREIGIVLGTSFQQIQKYEKGQNRIPVEKLYRLKSFYDVPYAAFFHGLEEEHLPQTDFDALYEKLYLRIKNVKDHALKRKLYDALTILVT